MTFHTWGVAGLVTVGLAATVTLAAPSSSPRTAGELPRTTGNTHSQFRGLAAAASTRATHSDPPATPHRWRWPLQPRPQVAAPFKAPPGPYEAGHRGVDLLTSLGAVVTAPTTATVDFAGMVAGNPVVSLRTHDGRRTTFQPVAALLPVGAQVIPGQAFARIAPGPSHCAPAACLHWGVIQQGTYLDPLSLVSAPRVRLLPHPT